MLTPDIILLDFKQSYNSTAQSVPETFLQKLSFKVAVPDVKYFEEYVLKEFSSQEKFWLQVAFRL